jgi:hypothetical protein
LLDGWVTEILKDVPLVHKCRTHRSFTGLKVKSRFNHFRSEPSAGILTDSPKTFGFTVKNNKRRMTNQG